MVKDGIGCAIPLLSEEQIEEFTQIRRTTKSEVQKRVSVISTCTTINACYIPFSSSLPNLPLLEDSPSEKDMIPLSCRTISQHII